MVGFLLWTALVLVAADGAPANPQLSSDVAKLVRQLDARDVTARDEAERKLMEMGAAVLPLLPVVGDRTPAEVAVRVTRVQQKRLQTQANAAADPSLVTLKGTDLPITEVFEAMAKQTGNTIVDHREAFGEEKTAAKVTVDFDKVPFWRALDQVLDQADLTLYGFSGQRGAYVINRSSGNSPRAAHAFYGGLLRLEPVRFESVRDLRNEDVQSLKFFLEASWEPRLQPFAILQPLAQVSAVGDSGEIINVASADAEPEATIREGVSAAELEIPLTLPKRGTEKIRSLKGKLLALVPGAIEDFHFRNLPVTAKNTPPKKVEQRKAGATVTIDQVRKNNDAWELSLRVKFEAPSIALESHRSWILENEAYFLTAAGVKIEAGGFEETRQTKDEVGITYFYVLKESPDKLEFVYRTPITILEVPVDYEFHDLRLP